MRVPAVVLLGAVLAVSACAVERTGLSVGEGGTPPVDGGRADGPAPDLAGSDLGSDDLGGMDLGVTDLGVTDLGSDDLGSGDLGSGDLGLADLGSDLGVTDLGAADLGADLGVDLGIADLGAADLGVTDLGPPSCADLGYANHRSCRELRDDPCLGPLASGLYTIDVDGLGPSAPVRVYCDMAIAGGGWTLVGRTDNVEATFGWTTPSGAPDVDNDPYALGLGSALVFTEVLVGRRGSAKDWGANPVFQFSVPVGFVAAYSSAAYPITGLTVVQGTCAPVGGSPTMLAYTGYTSATDHFFFGGSAALADTGLRGVDMTLTNSSCDISGTMDGHGGMLMVR